MTDPAISVEFLLMVLVLQIKVNCQDVYVSIDKYSGSVWDLSAKCLLPGFSLDKVSNFIWILSEKKPCIDCFLGDL